MLVTPEPGASRWREARDMADLGTLTAEWLAAELPFHPGRDPIEPSVETEELVPTLVWLNSWRFVTVWAQPGCDEIIEPEHERLRQRAAVIVLAWDDRLADRVVAVSRAAGLVVVDNGPARSWRNDRSTALVVTTLDGEPHLDVGTHLSRRWLRRNIFPGVGRYAVRAACDARQITVVDPRWGRMGLLWPTLRRAVEGGR